MFKEIQKELLLLQMNDALFPIGGYAHSFGLETYIQKGLVKDEHTAYDYITKRLLLCSAYTELLAVKLAYERSALQLLQPLFELEEVLKAATIPMELRDAAGKLGNRFVKTLVYAGMVHEQMILFQHMKNRSGKTMNHACAYGIFCCDCGIDKRAAMMHFIYAQASAMVTNCVKTVPLSQSVGQKLLVTLHPILMKTIHIAEASDEEQLCLSVPGFDLRCMQHEKLYSRIYMS
jgi:urease accessory protein